MGTEPGPHRPELPSDNGRGRENARLFATEPLLLVPLANEVIGFGRKARGGRKRAESRLRVQAASRQAYRWWSPPTRGIATTCAVADGRGVTTRSAGVSLSRPRCVLSSWK